MDPTDICNNEQKWKTFLSSIDTGSFKDLPTNNLKFTTKYNINCLATEFADKLLLKEGGTVVVKENQDDIEKSVDDIVHVTDDIVRRRHRDTLTPSKKNDIDKSCSRWDISNIAEYFMFDNCVTEIKMRTCNVPLSKDFHDMVQRDICHRLKIVKGIELKGREWNLDSELLMQLKSIANTETGSRLVLDALLIPLCLVHNLQFEVDKNINCNYLPNCRFDYCIRKDEHIVGCIEAKSVKSLSDKSVAQAVLQLMILQTTYNAIATETTLKMLAPAVPFFAIVTDGHRFIYIQLTGSSLGFEHDESGKVRIREVRQCGDFKDILEQITCLVFNHVDTS